MRIYSKHKTCFIIGFIISLSLIVISCNTVPDTRKAGTTKDNTVKGLAISGDNKPVITKLNPDVIALTKNFETFWSYWYDSVDLTREFIPLAANSRQITKSDFLRQLNTGNYMPVLTKVVQPAQKKRTDYDQGQYTYQLRPLPENIATSIPDVIRQMTTMALKDFKKEGTELPAFNLTTIEGENYTSANCKGKILVIDTWFVKCGACVREMPDLNRWVYHYKNRPDVIFLSLCLDDKQTIQQFLTRTGFAFLIVPDGRSYIENALGVSMFPTKILVNKEGKIVKTGNFKSIKRELAMLVATTDQAKP